MISISSVRRRTVAAFAACVALFASAFAFADSASALPPSQTRLTLINGWKSGPGGAANASVSIIHGIVHFGGAIWTKGNNAYPFVLPAPFRPAALLYVPVDMCNATNGRLIISADGTVQVQAESDFNNAKCLTSLDGATFAASPDGFKPLHLKNGWTDYGVNTAAPAARVIGGIVHFQGAIATAAGNPVAFVLPAAMRPDTEVYAKVDLGFARNGRLDIYPNGTTYVETEGPFSDAQAFTSLDGASIALTSGGFTDLSLINGWTEYGYGSANAAVKVISGIVQFHGAIATTGSDPHPFVLPAGFRPPKQVYLPVDTCNATNGRLVISPDGSATVEAETAFSNAACFTSLDGVSFHK